jgi:hypothetical protein
MRDELENIWEEAIEASAGISVEGEKIMLSLYLIKHHVKQFVRVF